MAKQSTTISPETTFELPPDAKLERAKRTIAEGIEAAIEAILQRGVAASEWISQHNSPLGRSAHFALARSGKVDSRKLYRRVLIRRTDLNRYIEERAEKRGTNRHEDDDVQDMIERI